MTNKSQIPIPIAIGIKNQTNSFICAVWILFFQTLGIICYLFFEICYLFINEI